MRLGVNVDHIATLREARRGLVPDPVRGALTALEAGADGITVHLREDRRHIQEEDVKALRKIDSMHLNLEMALSEDIIQIALGVKPDQVTFVPEKRQEVTTEGGLDVVSSIRQLQEIVPRFQNQNILVSLFVDPDLEQIRASQEAGADAVEIHTGAFAQAFSENRFEIELDQITRMVRSSKERGLKVFAGHGLDYNNISWIARMADIEEVNIGHSIVAEAVFVGMHDAVAQMKQLIQKTRLSILDFKN